MEVFGDPHYHLYTSADDEYVTCSAVGEHMLLMNDYVKIYGTNAVANDSFNDEASIMTGVRYDKIQCTLLQVTSRIYRIVFTWFIVSGINFKPKNPEISPKSIFKFD